MTSESTPERKYPWTTTVNGKRLTLRLMTAEDREALLAFTRSLPADDLLFLSIDLTRPEAVDQWVRNVESGAILAVMVESDGRMLGRGSLAHYDLMWTRHLGEMELVLSPELRGMGVGNILAEEIFSIAQRLKLQKVVARMAFEQRGAIKVFEKLGFHAEALLTDYVIDREGRTHDLIVMSFDVNGLS